MSATVKIPANLQRLTSGKSEVEVLPGTILSVVDELDKKYPGIKERLTKDGELAKFVIFYVNGEDVGFLNHDKTEVKNDYEVPIVPAVAGG